MTLRRLAEVVELRSRQAKAAWHEQGLREYFDPYPRRIPECFGNNERVEVWISILGRRLR